MRLLLTLALFTATAVTPPARFLPSGSSLASVTGSRVFPRLVGEPMPGWLGAYGGDEMASAYEGYHEEKALPGGQRLVLLRSQGLVGAYVLQGDRCTGELLFEPHTVEMPETLTDRLRRAGFRPRTGMLATRDRTYGVTATIYQRRRGAATEEYMLFDLPERVEGVLRPRTVVGAEAYFPTALAAALAPTIAAGTAALVEFCRTDEEKQENPHSETANRAESGFSMSYGSERASERRFGPWLERPLNGS